MGADEAQELFRLEATRLEKAGRKVTSARFDGLLFVIDHAKELRAQYVPASEGRRSDTRAQSRSELTKRLRQLDIFNVGKFQVLNFFTKRVQWVALHANFSAAAYSDDPTLWKAATGKKASGMERIDTLFDQMVDLFRRHAQCNGGYAGDPAGDPFPPPQSP